MYFSVSPKQFSRWLPQWTRGKPFQGSKLKKSSGRLVATNWRNVVTRCKFLVASLLNVNDAVHRYMASDISSRRRAAKFTKTREIPRNSVEILSNTCLYNIFETYLSYWGYLLAVNLKSYLDTLSLKRANNVPKLPGVDYVAKNWALLLVAKEKMLVALATVSVAISSPALYVLFFIIGTQEGLWSWWAAGKVQIRSTL